MTGMYEQSLLERRQKANADVARVRKFFAALKKKDSDYGDEHLALLFLFEQVADIYNNAPDKLTSRINTGGTDD